VFVENGATLTIEAGTVIKGLAAPSTGDQASALIVAVGGQIFANGTASEPIIFTAEDDDTSDPDDLDASRKGLWGGVIVLGDAPVGVDGGTSNIEGIPSIEGRATYGGNDSDDNSGVLRYISIRHAGSALEANNEINGLTLGGVGSGTTIEYVEVFANLDDGIEWFGGTVSVRYASVAFCGDDSFDYDQSWAGNGQFWFSIQDELSNRAGEWDGSERADLQPKVSPVLANLTFIGAGDNTVNEDNNDALRIRDDAAAQVYNSIFTGFARGAIVIDNDSEQDSWQRFQQGDLTFENNLFFDFGAGNTLAALVNTDGGGDAAFVTYLQDNDNSVTNPDLGGVSRTANGQLDPRPNAGSPALDNVEDVDNDFIREVNYRGAFSNRSNWLTGWTALSEYGYFGNLAEVSSVVVLDEDINAGDNVTWTADNEYFLDGYVFVENGATLTIEPGTVIKGLASPSTGDQASALIIARGGRIIADGTANAPIIFTAEDDDVEDGSDLGKERKGLWGGLIILGSAPVGVDGGTSNIEGIPSVEGRAIYGGDNPTDDSGILRYVSIRHGGSALEANNEINGLTLGGVGSGTTIEYVEVFANLDDGIEWFGGTVSVKYAVVAFCGDDSFDYDQSWAGNGQYWFSLQDELSNRAGEWDGSEAANLQPKASPVLANLTFIGAGGNTVNEDNNDALRIRDDAAAMVYNSIFTSFARGAIVIDNDSEQDSWQRFLQGDLTFEQNYFFDFGAGNTLAAIINTDGGGDAQFVTYLQDNDNSITNPQLGGISRMPNGQLDPRLDAGSPALGAATDVDNDFIDDVNFLGAFSNSNNWALGWTALDDNGYFGDLVTIDRQDVTVSGNIGSQTWTANNTYFLDGFVFVEPGETLTIEAGTVIKGLATPSNNDNASALIIARDATINANGTAANPIIFTAEDDDVNDPFDKTQFETGDWGGLIILGNAPLNSPESGRNAQGFIEEFIEGIPESRSDLGTFGGDDTEDNSGVIRYVSIRHGGAALIENEEINGLTLGGVGSETIIDYVEVYANSDDGIEWFGGNANVKHAVVAFCGDDSFDYDQGSNFKGQFWFSIGANEAGSNRAGEHDGATSPENAQPFTVPAISNVTYIGKGVAPEGEPEIILFRDNAGGRYRNSIFCESNAGIRVELNFGQPLTSNTQLQAANLQVQNSSFGGGALFIPSIAFNITPAGQVDPTDPNFTAQNNQLNLARNVAANIFTASGNDLSQTCPVQSISRDDNSGGLDPRTNDAGVPNFSGGIFNDEFFDRTDYRGAFAPSAANFWAGWTYLAQRNILSADLQNAEEEDETAKQ
jgi:hypothetical protein